MGWTEETERLIAWMQCRILTYSSMTEAVIIMIYAWMTEAYGCSLLAGILFLVTLILILIGCYDQETMVIPNEFLVSLLMLAAIAAWAVPEISMADRAVGFIAVSAPMLIMTVAIPDCFGGGDIKLMAACGLFLGWKGILLSMVLAVLSGGFYGIFLLWTRRIEKGGHFAFGPFLVWGVWTAMMYQKPIIAWYFRKFF